MIAPLARIRRAVARARAGACASVSVSVCACVCVCACACATPPPPRPSTPIAVARARPEEPPPLVVVKKPREGPPPPESAPAAVADAVEGKGARDRAHTMTVHLLDVGQGASTLVELPCGAILVDTGGESDDEFNSVDALRTQLDAFFARRADLKHTIDLLVITHPHIDHVRGIPMLVERYTVKNVVDDGLWGEKNVHDQEAALHDYVGAGKIGYRAVKRDDVDAKRGFTDDVVDPLRCKPIDPVVRVLSGAVDGDPGWGENKYGKREYENMNNHSVVVRFDFGKSSFLITGDLEELAIRDLVEKYRGTGLLDVDVYQAGHHGSHNGTTQELMTAMTPKLALIAMGPESRHHNWTAWAYGHPREPTVRLLEEGVSMNRAAVDVEVGTKVKGFITEHMTKAVYGTGWDGAVDVDLGADGSVSVRTHADGAMLAAP